MRNNLDLLCAEFGQKIAEKVKDENIIRNALSVLQEDGIYACFLYLLSKEDKKSEEDKKSKEDKMRELKDSLWEFLKHNRNPISRINRISGINEIKANNIHRAYASLSNSLENLLFAKELLERTLIYARYHAKAYGEE
uniref:CRISPR type III-B/RAMP module-associated protein Cmr5 n=1 Tax=candidate division WOR-3 bacterium TaxID=2052148 RepID=A0A7C3UPH3_UNCW3